MAPYQPSLQRLSTDPIDIVTERDGMRLTPPKLPIPALYGTPFLYRQDQTPPLSLRCSRQPSRGADVVDRVPHNDKPITEPSEDRLGVDPFAMTLASSIRKLAAPEGIVLGLNRGLGLRQEQWPMRPPLTTA